MARKRKCKRSNLERTQHDTAVKIRKMTDEQICDFIDEISNSRSNNDITRFLDKLEELKGFGNGISTKTIAKLRNIAVENGFIMEAENN